MGAYITAQLAWFAVLETSIASSSDAILLYVWRFVYAVEVLGRYQGGPCRVGCLEDTARSSQLYAEANRQQQACRSIHGLA